jgi:hypothetical protein
MYHMLADIRNASNLHCSGSAIFEVLSKCHPARRKRLFGHSERSIEVNFAIREVTGERDRVQTPLMSLIRCCESRSGPQRICHVAGNVAFSATKTLFRPQWA